MDFEPTPRAQRATGGKLRLKTVLETTTDPPAAVQAFRQEHNLGPTCENFVEFACLVRNSRSEIYLNLLDTLVKNLERSIPTMSREKQDELLKRSFHFVHTGDVLSKIPVSLLRRRSDIPKDYLDAFTQSPAFAASLPKMPIEVQRQVWCTETGLPSFESHLGIHMEKYRATLGQQHITRARTFRVVVVPQDKWRAHNKPLDAMVEAIGNRDELLEAACRLLLKRYAEAPDAEHGSVWAAMLFDLLLKFDLVERHLRPRLMEKRVRVARCLDTAVRTTGRLDGAALSELHKALLSQFPATATGAAAGVGTVAPSSLAAPTARQQQQSLSPEALKRLLEEAWSKLSEFDAERVFAEPVTDAIAPGYSNVIKKPMDLATMQAKIGASAYSSLDALSSDVDLMLANCVRFNTKASYFGTYASSLGVKWKSEKVKLQRKAKPPPPIVAPPAKGVLSSSTSSSAAAAGTPPNSNADSQLLLPPQPASSISLEGDVTLMLLAQPAISNSLHHTFVRLMEESLSARTLPAKHPHAQTLLQLLQLSHGARKAALSKLSIKPPEPVILRLLLPFYQRFLGEAAFSSKEFLGGGGGGNNSEAAVAPFVEALLADATWGAFLEIPLLRRFLLVSCGHAFVRQQPSSSSSKSKTLGDPPRAAALLKVLTLHATTDRHHYHLANDRWFLDALLSAATPPRYAGRVPEVRSAVLALLEALVRRKGYLCVAHTCLINMLTSWGNATMVGREAPWMNAEDVGAILRRVSLAGGQSSGANGGDDADLPRPAKRPYQPNDAPPRRLSADLWQSSEFSAVKAEYAKLKAAMPGLDVEGALGVVQ